MNSLGIKSSDTPWHWEEINQYETTSVAVMFGISALLSETDDIAEIAVLPWTSEEAGKSGVWPSADFLMEANLQGRISALLSWLLKGTIG